MISAAAHLVVWLSVAGLLYWLVTWALGQIGIPEPFNKVIRVVLILVVFLICLNALLSLAGHGLVSW